MDCAELLLTVREQMLSRTVVSPTGSGCKVALPFLEPSGDVVYVYVEERPGGLVVHDGGHIQGMLFEAGPGGASTSDKRALKALVSDTGLEMDQDSGLVRVYAEESNLVYWMMEIGRTVGVSAALIPTSIPRRKGSRRLGPRIANLVIKRLISEGLMDVIHPGQSIRGVTDQERYVDLTYTIPGNPLRLQPDTTVMILTLDLDVADPIAKAHRGIAAATDLVGVAKEEHAVDVRIVHSVGSADGDAERAERLIKVASAKHLLEDYAWDKTEEQDRFFSTLGQELAPLLNR